MRISSYARMILHGRLKSRPEDRTPIDIVPRQSQSARDLEAELNAPPSMAELQQWQFEEEDKFTNQG